MRSDRIHSKDIYLETVLEHGWENKSIFQSSNSWEPFCRNTYNVNINRTVFSCQFTLRDWHYSEKSHAKMFSQGFLKVWLDTVGISVFFTHDNHIFNGFAVSGEFRSFIVFELCFRCFVQPFSGPDSSAGGPIFFKKKQVYSSSLRDWLPFTIREPMNLWIQIFLVSGPNQQLPW